MSDLVRLFQVDETVVQPDEHRPRYNMAPTQSALVVATAADGTTRKLGTMRWGLIPHWADSPTIGNRMINARSDRVATSRAYRAAFATRRCLIPADGFYEWAPPRAGDPIPPGARQPAKRPFHFHTSDRTPVALAGLWETWRDAEGVPLRSFTILTTDANAQVGPVHDRMPVILDRDDWARWLTPTPLEPAERERLLSPASDGLLVADEVSTRVNRPVEDDPGLIEPLVP